METIQTFTLTSRGGYQHFDTGLREQNKQLENWTVMLLINSLQDTHIWTNFMFETFHESRSYQNSRIHEEKVQFSRFHEGFFLFSRITNVIVFTISRTFFFNFTISRTKKTAFTTSRIPLGGPHQRTIDIKLI